MRWTRRFLSLCTAAAMFVPLAGSVGAGKPAAAFQDPPLWSGYDLLTGHGGFFTFGTPNYGNPGQDPAKCPAAPFGAARAPQPDGTCWTMAITPNGGGYWVMNSLTGAVYHYGNAADFGDPQRRLAGVGSEFIPVMRQIVSAPDGKGYWVYEVGASGVGAVDPFGSAKFFGDTAHLAMGGSGFHGIPVGLAPTPTGKGYWEVYTDGGVFAFGDARFFGSLGALKLNAPIIGIEATPSGKGYWLVATDGGVFAFGDARFAGSAVGVADHPIIGMARNPTGPGYLLASDTGEIFTFGGAPFLGTPQGLGFNGEHIFAIAVAHHQAA